MKQKKKLFVLYLIKKKRLNNNKQNTHSLLISIFLNNKGFQLWFQYFFWILSLKIKHL